MKELEKELKKIIWLIGGLFVLYLVIRYWSSIEGVVGVAFSAAVPLLLGCIMAYVINILMNFYERWYDRLFKVEVARKIKRIVCIIFAFLSLIAIVFIVISLVLPELINCIASFIRLIPDAVDWVVDFIGEEEIAGYFPAFQEIDWSSISTEVEALIRSVLNGFGGAVGSIVSVVGNMVAIVVNVVIGLIFSLYVLIEKEKLGAQCKRIINTYIPKQAERIFYVVTVLDNSFHSFIVGQVTEAIVLGMLCILGMWICGFPYAVMIGVFIGFTALIPIAGAYIGAAVGAIMMLTIDPWMAVEFIIFIVVLQQLEGNLIYPRVVGKSIGLPGIWVLTAVTVGGGVLGIGGMLFAVPLAAAIYRLVKEDVAKRNAKDVKDVCVCVDEENACVRQDDADVKPVSEKKKSTKRKNASKNKGK